MKQNKAGLEPTDPLSLRVPRSVLARVRDIAREQDRTVNAQVVRIFREWLDQQQVDRQDNASPA